MTLASLRPLETVGYTLESFNLVEPSSDYAFTYYTFDENYRPELLDVWEIIGICQRNDNPWVIDIRFMHIEVEMLEREGFAPLRDARSYLSVSPTRVQTLIEFFEAILDGRGATSDCITRFHLMSENDLKNIQIPSWKVPMLTGHTYRYLPDDDVQTSENICVFSLPCWSSRYGANQSTVLKYATFQERQQREPQFDPSSIFGISTVTFDLCALEEFVILLRQYSYQNFIRI